MNKNSITQNPKLKQLAFINMDKQAQPLPLHVADRWDFDLTHYIQKNVYLYSVNDWLIGLGITDKSVRARAVNRVFKGGVYAYDLHTLPIPTSGGMKDSYFTDEKGLYGLASDLRSSKNRVALAEIKEYLSKAGVLVDKMRRGEITPKQVSDSMAKHLNDSGYTEDYQRERIDNVEIRKELSSELVRTVEGNINWGHIYGLFNISLTGKTKKQILADYAHATAKTSAIDGMGSMVVNQMNLLMMSVKLVLSTYADDGIPNKNHTESIYRIVTKFGKPLREHLEMLSQETGQPIHQLGENTRKQLLL